MIPPQRLLVFGGTGFLGRHLCTWALAHGWDITATHLSSDPGPTQISWQRCDIVDASSVNQIVESTKPTIVVNAAYRQSGDGAIATCGDGAGNVARAAADVAARTVHISTDLVFDGTLGRPYRESDPVRPISDYGQAKVAGESQVLAADPRAVVARTSLIYGEPTAPQERLVQRAADVGGIAFFVDEWRSPVEVTNLAAAVGTLALGDYAGIVHLAGDERINRLDFARLLARRLGLEGESLVGRTQDPSLGPRPKDVSLDCSLSRSLNLSIPGPSTLLTDC